jgi:hypothetical protein
MKALLFVVAPVFTLIMTSGMAGCSKPADGANAGAPASQASASAADPCDGKVVSQADAAAILGSPITSTKPLEGVAHSCRFETAAFSGMSVTIDPTRGKATVAASTSPHMPIPFTPVSSVGDAAAWQAQTHTLAATKGNLLCEITASGPPGALAGATSEKMSALCNKIFAAG